MTPEEFIRRFLLHVLPSGFRKIRHFGLLAPSAVSSLLPAAGRALAADGITLERRPQPEAESLLGDPIAPHEVCPRCALCHVTRSTLPPARAPPC